MQGLDLRDFKGIPQPIVKERMSGKMVRHLKFAVMFCQGIHYHTIYPIPTGLIAMESNYNNEGTLQQLLCLVLGLPEFWVSSRSHDPDTLVPSVMERMTQLRPSQAAIFGAVQAALTTPVDPDRPKLFFIQSSGSQGRIQVSHSLAHSSFTRFHLSLHADVERPSC